ncbi:UDP binding domain-containing protein, partial [Longispora fulva]|uniref:UDP binding domain-containing protein n=2 Tax=Bacteria TaxID=2 RepID=UPI003642A49D
YETKVTIYDPLANPEEVKHEYGLSTITSLPDQKFDAMVLTVAHKEFLQMDLNPLRSQNAVVYDVKGILAEVNGKL